MDNLPLAIERWVTTLSDKADLRSSAARDSIASVTAKADSNMFAREIVTHRSEVKE